MRRPTHHRDGPMSAALEVAYPATSVEPPPVHHQPVASDALDQTDQPVASVVERNAEGTGVPAPRWELPEEQPTRTWAGPRSCAGAALPLPEPEPVAPVAETVVEISPETIAALRSGVRPERAGTPLADAPLVEQLVAAAVGGDQRAKEQLLGEIHPLVLRYCRGRLGCQETVIGSADDVAQEVCLAVVGALPNYTIKGLSFRAFVYGIAAHKVTDAFRAIGRNRSEPMAELPDTAVTHDGPEQRLLAGELAERLGGMLHRLTPRQREVLILRIVAGLSAEEVAHIVGSTPGAVRVTQHRALNRLRAVMVGGSAGAHHDGAQHDGDQDDLIDV